MYFAADSDNYRRLFASTGTTLEVTVQAASVPTGCSNSIVWKLFTVHDKRVCMEVEPPDTDGLRSINAYFEDDALLYKLNTNFSNSAWPSEMSKAQGLLLNSINSLEPVR